MSRIDGTIPTAVCIAPDEKDSPPAACIPSPATRAPHPISVAPFSGRVCADNGYRSRHFGEVAGEGGLLEQTKQLSATTGLSMLGFASVKMGLPPPEHLVEASLKWLAPTSSIPGAPLATAEYRSVVPEARAEDVFTYFREHASEAFDAAGISLRPAHGALRDGMRLYLEDREAKPVPVWAPVEVRIDGAARTIGFTTLDGHPLRGRNNFQVLEHPHGAEIVQQSELQGSSPLADAGVKLLQALERQEDIWKRLHGHISDAQNLR